MSSSHVADVPGALTLSRRLDWRFLLPDPRLGRVGFLGPAAGDLLPALQAFSESVERLPDEGIGHHDPSLDLMVVVDPNATTLERAARRLRPGGFLYAEARSTLGARMLAARSPARLAAEARRCGFVDVTTHWHWPSFATGTRLVPLDDATALGFVLTRGRPGIRARVLTTLARLAVSSRFIAAAAACVSLTGRLPER